MEVVERLVACISHDHVSMGRPLNQRRTLVTVGVSEVGVRVARLVTANGQVNKREQSGCQLRCLPEACTGLRVWRFDD